MNTDGIAPMNGPKKGITLVMPTITLIIRAKGILHIVITMKVSTPMMKESMIRPTMNPMKVSFTMLANSYSAAFRFCPHVALTILRMIANSLSL